MDSNKTDKIIIITEEDGNILDTSFFMSNIKLSDKENMLDEYCEEENMSNEDINILDEYCEEENMSNEDINILDEDSNKRLFIKHNSFDNNSLYDDSDYDSSIESNDFNDDFKNDDCWYNLLDMIPYIIIIAGIMYGAKILLYTRR